MTNTTTTTPAQRLAAMFAKASTRTLAQSLRMVDAKKSLTRDERQAKTWIIQELERRYPAADAAVGAAFEAAAPEAELDYVALLLDAIGTEAGR